METLILCGGKGTRAYPHTAEIPKPLIHVGNRPILQHVMEIYARQGFSKFILSAGYRAEEISKFARGLNSDWEVQVVDTGEDAGTAFRVKGCATLLSQSFFVTYGDGLGNIDLRSLVAFHESHNGAATVSAVPLPSPYGTMTWDQRGRVTDFLEKPQLKDHWINAGFFLMDRRCLEMFLGDDLEHEVLPHLASKGELYVFEHTGFWSSMDTYKDAVELSKLCSSGDGPWMNL